MEYKLTYPRDDYNELELDKQIIYDLINKHFSGRSKIMKCMDYYNGNHLILSRTRADENAVNNKIVCNHAKDITDTATGYFMSSEVTYSGKEEENTSKLTEAFLSADTDSTDYENSLNMSKCGLAYEYIFMKEGESQLKSKSLEPANTFMVYDDSIEQEELFGVYYDHVHDDVKNIDCFKATVGTENYVYTLVFEDPSKKYTKVSEVGIPHNLGCIPIIEYRNNYDGIGDFEQQISLIDAYNLLMSDRVNDKEQFLKSILVIYGALLGDDAEETAAATKELKAMGLLELPDGSKAEYVTRQFDEDGVEVLRKAIKEDIYSFSHVPNLTDQNFVGNSSGVAMEYKLLGLEKITDTKTRYFKKGLYKRIRIFCNVLGLKSIIINPKDIDITLTRELPKNYLELSQMIANLKGTVSNKTLISQLGFVKDPQQEAKDLQSESKQAYDDNQQFIQTTSNGEVDVTEEE